ncbi:MAG: Nif3-like dinuclear metal center hexameric protein [Clostridia bacterium]|nr:Nif3-like dinuclear metal center hexameric protein [Clostridia bacterium]
MSITVGKIYEYVDEFAPFLLAEERDNSGLLVGSKDAEVKGILLALDVSLDAVNMAAEQGANLIISHHPVIFDPLSEITDSTATGRVVLSAIKNGINIICAHTNLDAAEQGISYTLAEMAGLEDIYTSEFSKLMRIGELKPALKTEEFILSLKQRLKIDTAYISRNHPDKIKTVAVVSGRGCSLLNEAKLSGADAFLLGEIKYENQVYADILDICVISCGHYETESIILPRLKNYLQTRLNGLQFNLGVYEEAPMLKK